ncbi:MAG: hypothetical protein HQL17_02730 [Candidatus Omnitrophica bacterium]|nr:hypothetical protein [Candidatus Omnitrophota bacterium]
MTSTVKRKPRKKPVAKKKSGGWHLGIAYTLGKTVKKVSGKVGKSGKSGGKRSSKKRAVKKDHEVAPVDLFKIDPEAPLAPILKELKAMADISGLTAAIQEMQEISLKHSTHPVVNQLIVRVQQLPPHEQEMLSRKFIERVQESIVVNQPMFAFPPQRKMTEEDCQKLSSTFIDCLTRTLEDAGMTPQEKEFLQKFSDDVTRPLNELMLFYLHPKTFSQKVKRLWRMQRIIIKMVKVMQMSNDMVKRQDAVIDQAFAAGPVSPANYWMNEDTKPIRIKEKDLIHK